MCTDDPRDALFVPITSSSTRHRRHPPPRRPLPCPSPIPSPCQASCSSSVTKILGSPTTLASTYNTRFALSPRSFVVDKSRLLIFFLSLFNHSFRFPFRPCPTVQAKHHRRLDLAPAVAPLDTHSFPPQKQYRSPLDYIAMRDCRRRRTFPSLSLFTHIYFVAYLFLPQHRRRINTHRPPHIRSSDHRGISFPLSLLCDSLFSSSLLPTDQF